jgi:hypothetical protein
MRHSHDKEVDLASLAVFLQHTAAVSIRHSSAGTALGARVSPRGVAGAGVKRVALLLRQVGLLVLQLFDAHGHHFLKNFFARMTLASDVGDDAELHLDLQQRLSNDVEGGIVPLHVALCVFENESR